MQRQPRDASGLVATGSGVLTRRLTRSAGTSGVLVQDVDKIEVIGRGGEGTVWKALWQGHIVALKEWHLAMSPDHLAAIRREVDLLRTLRHPHVVEFFGACTEPPSLCLIMEFAAGGTLAQLIHGQPGVSPPSRLTLLRVIQLSEDIASALDYLHSARIVHRDIKPSNVLLNATGRAALTDFGISKYMPGTRLETQNVAAGTLSYMAPELFLGSGASEKVDVYSFAIVLWEMLAAKLPLKEYGGNPMGVMHAVCDGVRPNPMPRRVPRRLQSLIHDMWAQEPGQRPAVLEVRHRLAALHKEEAKNASR
jgi:serine/threonine protein kinase